jgi:hypothetical protein
VSLLLLWYVRAKCNPYNPAAEKSTVSSNFSPVDKITGLSDFGLLQFGLSFLSAGTGALFFWFEVLPSPGSRGRDSRLLMPAFGSCGNVHPMFHTLVLEPVTSTLCPSPLGRAGRGDFSSKKEYAGLLAAKSIVIVKVLP